MKRIIPIILILSFFVFLSSFTSYAQDWKEVADNLVIDYRGKVVSIEQLNSSTCWAVLSPDLSVGEAVEVAENVGYYIRNSTGGIRGKRPSVHVFIGTKHVAVARPSGLNYVGKISMENWNPSDFKGEYRP